MPEARTEPDNDTGFMREFKTRFKEAEKHAKEWRKEAQRCYEFVAGHQLSDQEKAELEEQLRAPIVFNRIDPVVSSIQGHEINNRQQVTYFARELGDVKPAEVYNAAAKWVDEESDSNEEVSDAFWDMGVTGMGWTETRISYDDDPDGMIYGAERISPLEMGWDPTCHKRNLNGGRFVYRGRWWNREEAEEMWPKVGSIEGFEDHIVDTEPTEPHDASRAWMYENDQSQWYNKDKDEVFIVQYQYFEMKKVYLIADPISQKIVEMSESRYNNKNVRRYIEEKGHKVIMQRRKQYKQAFIMGEHVLENGDAPCKDEFTLLCMTGKRDEAKKQFYGIVRPMIDPQRWSNKFFSEIQDIMSKNRTGGAFVEETALTDPRKAEETWNDPNPLIVVADGALSNGRIQERNPIQYPMGLDRLMQFAVTSIPQVTGINYELLGMVDREQAGVLEAQRKRAAMTIISNMFDSLRRHTKARGRVLLYFINEYISDGRLIRIVGQGKEQYVPLTKQADVKYDIVSGESPTSPDQKAETFAILSQVLPMAMQQGFPVPPEVLDYLPLPAGLVDNWKKMIQPDPKQQKFTEQMKQLAQAAEQAKIAKDESIAALNRVKAMVEQVEARIKPYEAMSQMMKQ